MPRDIPASVKMVTAWLLLATAIFLGVQWWQHESQRARFVLRGEVVELQRGRDGHYHWPGSINGQAVDFLVDTGATQTVIPTALARSLQLKAQGVVRSQTAGGPTLGELVVGDLALQGGVRVDRMRLVAMPALGERPLLGMDLLGRLQWHQVDGVLRIDLRARRD